jgi:hypothetical protein
MPKTPLPLCGYPYLLSLLVVVEMMSWEGRRAPVVARLQWLQVGGIPSEKDRQGDD